VGEGQLPRCAHAALELFEFEQNEGAVVFNADYEVELRALIEGVAGHSEVEIIFPHTTNRA